jgi:hypothetical protein
VTKDPICNIGGKMNKSNPKIEQMIEDLKKCDHLNNPFCCSCSWGIHVSRQDGFGIWCGFNEKSNLLIKYITGENTMYNYGEKILVRGHTHKFKNEFMGDGWAERIFVSFTNDDKIICVDKDDEKKFLNSENFSVVVWKEHKSIAEVVEPK